MTVNLTASETLNGAAVADALVGGGLGMNMGLVSNQFYAPLIDKATNTGQKDIYIRHDGTNLISTLGVFIGEYGAGTGFTYGGTETAAADFTTVKDMGSTSGVSKNNADGNSGGFWMEMNASTNSTTQFEIGLRPDEVKTFGKSAQGIDISTYFLIHETAMVYDSGGEAAATSPVQGQLGPAGDTVLGDNAHLKFRYYVPTTYLEAKTLQWETIFSYSYTA
jgi:hypothetical protein